MEQVVSTHACSQTKQRDLLHWATSLSLLAHATASVEHRDSKHCMEKSLVLLLGIGGTKKEWTFAHSFKYM